MTDRDCANCKHHTEDGCSSWDCEYEPKDLISRADAIEAVQKMVPYVIDNDTGKWGILVNKANVITELSALQSAEDKNCWNCKHYEPKYDVCHDPELVKQVTSKLNNPCDSLLTDDSVECKEQKSKLEHDREWIIGCIKHDGFIKTDRFDKANQIILDALSADAEWIPCSERMPSEDGCYLVYMSWEYYNMDVLRWVDGWNCYRGHDGKIGRENEIDGADILAWMPLPTPYKGGEDE